MVIIYGDRMKKTFKYLLVFALMLSTVFATACDKQPTESETRTTSIYFEDGTVKEYNSSAVINPFRDIKVKFSGKANNGTATIDTSNCEDIIKDNFTFICQNNGKLTNGCTATIKVVFDSKAFENAGYTVTADEKSYVVTGVDFYSNAIQDYEKDDLNNAVRTLATKYIEDNIKTIDMEYDSGKDRNGWSESGSFEYTYNYHDRIMIYNYNRNDRSQNTYFIIYELSNEINCTEDMTTAENPMKAGESDTGWVYIAVGATNVTATSDMIFNADFNQKEASEIIRSFTSYDEAIEYCTYGGEYITLRELFV